MADFEGTDFQETTGSILTPSQREFLRNGPGEDQSAGALRMTKSRIRNRLGAAMVDFSLLLTSEHLGHKDLEKAFTEPVDIQYSPIPAELIQEAIGVLFIGTLAAERSDGDETDGLPDAVEKFRTQVIEGLERAVTRRGQRLSDLTLELDLAIDEGALPDDSAELYELSADQLDRLRLANRITETEYVDAIVKRYQKDPVGEDRVETSSDQSAE